MSEDSSVTEGYQPSPLPADQQPQDAPEPRKSPILRVVVALVIGGATIYALQRFTAQADHQNANLGSLAVGLLTWLYILFQFHRLAIRAGHRRLVPIACLAGMAAFPLLFEFEGFSGEMWPQIKFRFRSGTEMTHRQVGERVPVNPEIEADLAQAPEKIESREFLGDHRSGKESNRQFSIPDSSGEIETVWSQGIGEGWSSFSVADGLAVTMEQRGGMECLTCYRVSNGELVWINQHETRHKNALGGIGPRSTPTIFDQTVFAQGATGIVWCVDLQTGEIHWQVDLLKLAGWDQLESESQIVWGRAGSPLFVPANNDGVAMCVLPFGGPDSKAASGRSLIAFDAESGETIWTAGKAQISYASPMLLTLAGKQQIVIVNEGVITGHDVRDGDTLWTFDWPGISSADANCSSVIAAGKDRFLVGKGYGGGSALVEIKATDSGFQAEERWSSSIVLKTKFTHAFVDGPYAYAISNGSLEAVEIESARRLWSQPRRSRYAQGQIILVDDTIVAQSESGEVALVAADPEEFRELIRFPALTSKTWNVPTVAGRFLLVRNDRQAICFLLPPR